VNEWEWEILEAKPVLDEVHVQSVRLRRGDRVRLQPRAGGDVFDLALTGRIAVIESIEQDYEGKLHVSVVLDDDPGRDIGLMRQPGHRFFFTPEELQPVLHDEESIHTHSAAKSILVAGIGNIFLGDDGFGVEVAARLAARQFPPGVRVADFGIRGFDLAYALMEGYASTILIDAAPGEAAPGTLSLIEPDLSTITSDAASPAFLEPHAMNPLNVLRMAARMGAKLQRILLVGCVPATLGLEEGQLGLSEPVTAALDEATTLVESLVARILAGEWPGTVSS
jgi:hydrogenase maturation protease